MPWRSETFAEYKQYCEYFDRVALGKNTFFQEMESKGITAQKDGDGIYIYRNFAFNIWQEEDQKSFRQL